MRCTFLIPVLVLLNAISFILNAQPDLKMQIKSPKAFVAIAYQDIKGEGINPSVGKSLEKSYASFGDKTILRSIILKDLLLGQGLVKANPVLSDAEYLSLLELCPKMSSNRNADPYLVCMANFLYRLSLDTGDLTLRFQRLLDWQRNNIPNAPFGLNEPPENKTEREELEWGIVFSANWMKKFPEEFKKSLSWFNQIYGDWKKKNPSDSYEQFIKSLIMKLGFVEQNSSVFFEKKRSSDIPSVIPDAAEMKKDPGRFVREMYEALLIRKPTDEEFSFLVNYIKKNPQTSPSLLYFSLMTSKEYNFY